MLYDSATKGGLKRFCVEAASAGSTAAAAKGSTNTTNTGATAATAATAAAAFAAGASGRGGGGATATGGHAAAAAASPPLLPRPEVLCFISRVMLAAGQDLLCSRLVEDLLPRSIARSWPGARRALEGGGAAGGHFTRLVEVCNATQ